MILARGDGLYGARTQATYARAGFSARVPRGPAPALIVVDLTRGFTEAGFPAGSDLSDVVAAAARLLGAAHAAGVPVVLTSIEYTDAEADGDSIAWLRKATGLRGLRVSSNAVAIDPRLPVAQADHRVVKKGASAFSGTGLAALLAGLRVDTVVVCGATTSGCVRATVVDAVQSGLNVLVPREAVGDRAEGPHEAALFDMDAKYGDVVGLNDAVSYLQQRDDD